jgi:hypothetical protein
MGQRITGKKAIVTWQGDAVVFYSCCKMLRERMVLVIFAVAFISLHLPPSLMNSQWLFFFLL